MTEKAVADDVLGQFARQEHDWFERVRKGSLDPEEVSRAVQAIIDRGGALPNEMTIGDRTYEILGFLEGDEQSVPGKTMVERAKKMQAHLGQDDGQYLLDRQEQIPAVLRGKVAFVFTDWRGPDDPGDVTCLGWDGGRWVQYWVWLDSDWSSDGRVLRRKLSA